MEHPFNVPHIRNITVSGRIASGATSLAKHLSEVLGWELLEGGKLMREINAELGISMTEENSRPDNYDLLYEDKVKTILRTKEHHIIQSHLAGFDAQGIEGVFKILVVCEDEEGNDHPDVRIDRLVNRDSITVDEAKHEVKERDWQNLAKFRRLYVNNDQNWVYWDKKYYDLVVSTYTHNKVETFEIVLAAVGYTNV